MAPEQPSPAATSATQALDVFVSYAREDRDFVGELSRALEARGRTAWVDWQSIPPSAEWMLEIEDAVVRAQAYVFVISPDSASSSACADEAAIAGRHNKKIVPVVAEEVDPTKLPALVASRQWIEAREDFEAFIDRLISALDTDLAWTRTHTRLLQDAVRWHADSEGTTLLEGRELEDAEAWLAAAEGHETQPTPEQEAFIAASRWAASSARAERHYERSFELSRAGRRQAAAAHLLRAVELTPLDRIPAGYPVSPERPGWAADAWTAFRYLDAERGRMRGRLRAPAEVSCIGADSAATRAVVGCMSGSVQLWDLDRCEPIADLPGIPDAVTAVALSPAGEVVAAGVDGSVLAWPVGGAAPRSLFRTGGNPVTAIAFAPDGRQAFGLRDGHVLVRDAAGDDVRHARLHNGSVTSLAFDAAGRVLTGSGRPATGSWLAEGSAIAWDLSSGAQQPRLFGTLEDAPVAVAPSEDGENALRSLASGVVELFAGSRTEHRDLAHPETVRAVAFGPGVAITGCDDGCVRTWDVATARRLGTFDGHLGPVTCVAATGNLLLSGSLDASVAVWEVDRGPARVKLADEGRAVASSPATGIAIGADDGAVKVLDREGEHVARLGRSGPVTSVAVSPDGGIVVAGHQGGALAVWDAGSRKRLGVRTDHAGIVWEVAFSPDGTLAASASKDGTARLWETSDWTPRATLGHDDGTNGVAFAPGGGRVVTGGQDGAARVWSSADGRLERSVEPGDHALTSVRFTLDGQWLVATDDDGTIHIWPVDGTPAQGRTIKAHERTITTTALGADGRLLLTASLDASVRCWDMETGREVQAFAGHTDGVYGVVSFHGRVWSAGMDGKVWVWDIGSDEPLGSYDLTPRRASALALGADGSRLAVGTLEGDVFLKDTASDEAPALLAVGHTAAVDGLAFDANGSLLASVARDRTARLWTLEDARQVFARRLDAPATSVAWHPSRPRLLCGTGDKQELVESSEAFGAMGGRLAPGAPAAGGAIVWDFHAGPPRFLERHAGPVQGIAIAPDGRIVTAGDDVSVRIWDPASGSQLRLLEGHRDRVWAVAVSPDGSLAATGSIDNDVRIWDLESGESIRVIEHHTAGVGSVAFAADGTRLVTASADGAVRVLDVVTGDELQALRGHAGGVVAVAVDAEARRALSGTLEGELLLWDLTGADPPRGLPAHDDSIWGVAMAPDGRSAVTSSEDGTARVWDLETGEVRHELTARRVALRHAAISPDGSEVAIGGADYAVRRWDLRSGELLGILTGHWSEAISVAYDAAGGTIASGAEDGAVRRWARGQDDPLDWIAGQWGDALVARYDGGGARIVVGGADGSVRVWDADRGELVSVLRGHAGPVTDLQVHPDGRRAVTCSMDGSVRLWDLAAAREVRAFTDNEGPVFAVLFLDGGEVIASTSADQTVRVRSTRTGRLLRTIAGERRARFDLVAAAASGSTMQVSIGAGTAASALAPGPDGRSLLVAAADGTARVALVRPDTPAAQLAGSVEGLYRSVGLRIAAETGEVVLA